MKGTDHFKRTIQMYLEQRAAEDELFAKNYRNPAKNIADRIISLTFIIGSSLAAIGGVLIANHVGQVNFFIGFIAGIKAFTAAVFGGIGSIPGAMIGGIAIGLCECFVSAIGLSAWKDAVTFAILIIVLLVTPTGFLGRKVQETV